MIPLAAVVFLIVVFGLVISASHSAGMPNSLWVSRFCLEPDQFARLICGYRQLSQGTALTRNWNAMHNGRVLIYLPAGGAARYFRPRSITETELNMACSGR